MIDFQPPDTELVKPEPRAPRRAFEGFDLASQRQSLAQKITPILTQISQALTQAKSLILSVSAPVITVLKPITGLGWTMIITAILSWIIGARFGWVEGAILAVFLLAGVGIGALFTIGRSRLEVNLNLTPSRVFAANSAVASFEMKNVAGRRMSAARVRLPIGETSVWSTTPALGNEESFDDIVTIATAVRGVITVGPVMTYRSDPWGMVRREVAWTDTQELFVHPKIVALDELGNGLLRDLEGQSTLEVSNSDLAFHSLRDYVPGDDRRHIHWKSTARLSAMSGKDLFMVRQFLDTRKSHIAVISDLEASHYSSEEEFELSMSCAASVSVRTVMDDMDLTILCGDNTVVRPKSNYALDTYSRAEWGSRSLESEFERVVREAGDASFVVLVTGSKVGFEALQRGCSTLPYTARMLVICTSLGEKISMRSTSGFIALTVGSLEDLPRAISGGSL
ncbi:MAG: DUF58 domain-containing protein [Propionibacteriaceae bacterium]|nr:DUF58 domain-containing protein [Propionibacteriaceae bacterium]